MDRSSEVAAALRTIYQAVSDGDEQTLTAMLSSREGLVFIGTDPDEWFEDTATVRQLLKAQAAAGIRVRGGDVLAYEEGTVGWAADQGAFLLPDGSEAPFRITVVFHREQGEWKVVQEHASVAVSNEEVVGTEL